jgi:hypothetical protein
MNVGAPTIKSKTHLCRGRIGATALAFRARMNAGTPTCEEQNTPTSCQKAPNGPC